MSISIELVHELAQTRNGRRALREKLEGWKAKAKAKRFEANELDELVEETIKIVQAATPKTAQGSHSHEAGAEVAVDPTDNGTGGTRDEDELDGGEEKNEVSEDEEVPAGTES